MGLGQGRADVGVRTGYRLQLTDDSFQELRDERTWEHGVDIHCSELSAVICHLSSNGA